MRRKRRTVRDGEIFLKLIATKEKEIERALDHVEKGYEILESSPMISNGDDSGFHILLTIRVL